MKVWICHFTLKHLVWVEMKINRAILWLNSTYSFLSHPNPLPHFIFAYYILIMKKFKLGNFEFRFTHDTINYNIGDNGENFPYLKYQVFNSKAMICQRKCFEHLYVCNVTHVKQSKHIP